MVFQSHKLRSIFIHVLIIFVSYTLIIITVWIYSWQPLPSEIDDVDVYRNRYDNLILVRMGQSFDVSL